MSGHNYINNNRSMLSAKSDLKCIVMLSVVLHELCHAEPVQSYLYFNVNIYGDPESSPLWIEGHNIHMP